MTIKERIILALSFCLLTGIVSADTENKSITKGTSISNTASEKNNSTDEDLPPESVKMPNGFEQFSSTDILRRIFVDYDVVTGKKNKTSKNNLRVMLVDAKNWKTQNEQTLLVLIGLEHEPGYFDRMEPGVFFCGSCEYGLGIAVLQKTAGTINLIAYSEMDGLQSMSYHGYSYFDLAPYKLNNQEGLIGLRQTASGSEYTNDSLILFRIENKILKKVFERSMSQIYAAADGYHGSKLILLLSPNAQGTNDFIIKGKMIVSDFPIDTPDYIEEEHIISEETIREVWRFDGIEYKKIK